MPNLVAYNPGGLVTDAVQFGTIVMDVNNTVSPGSLIWCPDYGICNQYFIITDSYTNGKTSQINSRAMGFPTTGLTDSALILSINKLAASKSSGPFATLTNAITWAISEGYFIINQEYPSIVTSGCILNLDASLPASYPLVLNNWYDLSGNGNTGTLDNVTYSSSFYGNLSFVSLNSSYISFTSPSNIPSGNNNYTISTWFNPSSLGTKGLVGWGNYGTTNQVNSFRLSATGLVNSWQGNDLSVTTSLSTGSWYNAVATFDGITREIWVNGVSAGSDTPTNHNVTTTSNLTIGRTNTSEYFDGSIGEVQIFNTGLSPSEIVQNYNALLPRYNGSYTDPCNPAPNCTPTPTPTSSMYTFCLGYSATDCEIACSASCTTYYSYCSTLIVSCSLYTDNSGSIAPDGYYSDGVDCYHLVTPPVTPTPTETPTPTPTDLSLITTYTISGCTSLSVFVADLNSPNLFPGDTNNIVFTGATPSGCYTILGKTNTTPTDGILSGSFYTSCSECINQTTTVYSISGCTNMVTLNADLVSPNFFPGDVFKLPFTGATPTGCYTVIEKVFDTPSEDTIITTSFFLNCALCEASLVTPTPTVTQTPTPTVTQTRTPTQTPTRTGTPTPTNINAQGFSYANFASTAGITLVGAAAVSGGTIIALTTTSSAAVGNMYRTTAIQYNRNFSTQWSSFIGGGTGADGYCVQWTTTNNTNGTAGGGVGRIEASSTINAIGFYTYTINNFQWYKSNVLQSTTSVSAGFWRQQLYFWADYNNSAQTLALYYSTTNSKPGSPNITYSSFSFDTGSYYMGFGAAIGGSNDNQEILSWSLQFT